MDKSLLEIKGIKPKSCSIGSLKGYELLIGERATLIRSENGRAYGAMMDISSNEANHLYAEESVKDYLPEPVNVELMNGKQVEAICYNLPSDKVTGTNKNYARSLLIVAKKLGLPDSYIKQIE